MWRLFQLQCQRSKVSPVSGTKSSAGSSDKNGSGTGQGKGKTGNKVINLSNDKSSGEGTGGAGIKGKAHLMNQEEEFSKATCL
ncbi:MAG: hypothetical protein R2771_10360 [Saprospiraceae bacterium]